MQSKYVQYNGTTYYNVDIVEYSVQLLNVLPVQLKTIETLVPICFNVENFDISKYMDKTFRIHLKILEYFNIC